MKFPILYEDSYLLVIDKPAGIVVNRASSVKGETVQDWAERRMSNVAPSPKRLWRVGDKCQMSNENKDYYDRCGIVHRIDKETSGILLIAKTPEAFRELQRQFKERHVRKTYLAIVHGKLVPKAGEIRAPVGRLPWNPERFGVVPGGKEAVTRYNVIIVIPASEPGSRGEKDWIPGQDFDGELSRTARNDISFVELSPETGRTHQIRVHLKYINHPIVGDFLYAGRKTSRRDRAWAPRVMLHAWKISLVHPGTEKILEIESPIPDDMKRIIQN